MKGSLFNLACVAVIVAVVAAVAHDKGKRDTTEYATNVANQAYNTAASYRQTAEQRANALKAESARADGLSKELADARAEAQSLTAQLRKADAELAKPKQCPMPDYSPYEKQIADLKSQLATAKDALLKAQATKPAIVKAEEPKKEPPKPDRHIVKWQTSLAAGQKLSKELNRPMFIAFSTQVCPWCEQERAEVYEQDEVGQVLCREYVPVWTTDGSVAADYGVTTVPQAAIDDGTTWTKFRPATTPRAFLDQLKAKRGKL